MKLRIIRNVVSLAIVAIIIAFAVYSFFNMGTEDIPVTLPKPTENAEVFVSDELGLGKYTIADISPSTVAAIVQTLSRADEYSRTLTITNYWDGGENIVTLDCFVSGTSAHVIRNDGYSSRHELIVGNNLHVWYDDAAGTFSGTISEPVYPYYIDQMSHLQTYEDLLTIDSSYITDAGYVTAFGEGCVFAEYISGDFNYRTRVYVSIDTGLLMGAERYDGDTLIYEMTSNSPNLSSPDLSHFNLP